MSPFHFASGGRPRKPWVGVASALPPSSLQGAVLLDFKCRLQRCWFSASPPPRLLPGRPPMTHSFRQSLRAPAVQAAQPAPNSPAVPFSLAHRPLVRESIVGVSHFGGGQCGGTLPVFMGRLGPRSLCSAGEFTCSSPLVRGLSGPALLPAASPDIWSRFAAGPRAVWRSLCSCGTSPAARPVPPPRQVPGEGLGPEPASRDSLTSPRLGRPCRSSAMRRPSVLPRGPPLGSCMASGLFCAPLPFRPGHP